MLISEHHHRSRGAVAMAVVTAAGLGAVPPPPPLPSHLPPTEARRMEKKSYPTIVPKGTRYYRSISMYIQPCLPRKALVSSCVILFYGTRDPPGGNFFTCARIGRSGSGGGDDGGGGSGGGGAVAKATPVDAHGRPRKT